MFIKDLNFIQIPKQHLPSRYKQLLDHSRSMTLRLENFYRQEMAIKVIENQISNNIYKREIVMFGKKDYIPRELAYIEVFLKNLPNESSRQRTIEGKEPFGKILIDYGIKAKTEIKFFFKIHKNKQILKYSKNHNDVYYGREYSIFSLSKKRKLANVIEGVF